MISSSSTSRTRVVGAAVLLVVFVAGAAVGIAVERLVRPGSGIQTVFKNDMSGVLDRLELSSAQRAQAAAIIERRTPATEAMMIELGNRLHETSDSLDAELRAILTPQQRLRLDSLRSQRQLMIKRKIMGPGGTKVDTVFPRTGRDTIRH
jgi:Spy/CpxP family protein refolding chaperone